MSDLAAALGLALVIEGVIYAGFPGRMKAMIQSALELPDSTLRAGGLALAATGLFIVWLVRA